MKKFYFTFGSWEGYPYQNTYLVVEAESRSEAVRLFREKYPDKSPDTVNCAIIYSEYEWKSLIRVHYDGMEPADFIQSELAAKWHRITVLLENTIKLALDEFHKKDLLGGIGTTEHELEVLGVDLKEVFK